MSDAVAMDLIHLADPDGDRCVVRVTGRYRPGVPAGHDILRADVLAHTDFVDARLDLYLSPEDLDAWERRLSELEPGRSAVIGGGRGPTLEIHLHEDGELSVQITDPDRLWTALGIRPQKNWTTEHHKRLQNVRTGWPRETTEPSPGVYEWAPNHER
ncbi:DUF5959 family protein [Streptomyces sp. NBC_00525]|uniref:DUF5959 family protein n=1 Tax=Streptomyces sp. NBC_00525 TaxID=2903660 RepID=UPI002E8239E1|nr:DUF5959 family protein [Streptomyces sp. NBC_00525]WUC95190.1 DUF5959 family protein [Streptomyces sp. NBC_00525]